MPAGWYKPTTPMDAINRHSSLRDDTVYIETAGQRVRYRVRGDGPPLLMLHGIGAPLEYWSRLEDRLLAFQTITVDVLGLSLGGMIAQELAYRNPRRVGRLILEQPPVAARARVAGARDRRRRRSRRPGRQRPPTRLCRPSRTAGAHRRRQPPVPAPGAGALREADPGVPRRGLNRTPTRVAVSDRRRESRRRAPERRSPLLPAAGSRQP